ncbi:2,3-bisphosphoglycerate-independent phosphoglycerate mutase [Candidatus Gottesmanbacteria bacterium]|nr:2,3-bisphosphoglycerate-independent phosphoglycerate mutase [Candidatus Gottesmanbacteria bacterium]
MKPVVLIILDGWGLAPPGPGNAISQAKLTHIPSLWASYPHTQLSASGEAVGLPSGEDGNTETGHINIGAGRVVYQDLPRINMAIADGSFFTNEAFLGAIKYAQEHKSNLHLMGLIGDAGVHSNREHLWALLQLLKRYQTANQCDCRAFLHLFTDGRDSPPTSAKRFIQDTEDRCQKLGVGHIATIIGRYYAMDRDHRWERTESAYRALTETGGLTAPSAQAAIEASYAKGKTDEFIDPTIILDQEAKPYPRIANHDAVIFFNYRIDRPRQLTRALILPDFEDQRESQSFDPYAVKYFHKHVVEPEDQGVPFTRQIKLPNIFFVTMTEYERDLPAVVAYPPNPVSLPLGAVLADHNIRQLRVSETEKERFVTYYFNGMREMPLAGEDRLIIPSPKVATYDLQPDMASRELTTKIIDRLAIDVYGFILVNFANPDMVAHTGSIGAAIRACETADACVGAIVEQVLARSGTCVITGDHGNVEEMLDINGQMDTEHSTFPVPLIMIDHDFDNYPVALPAGKLADVAPTILSHMRIPIPSEMTGNNLLADVHTKNF